MSNLNKYLAYNNLWTLEKLVNEFKQIHANKVGQVYSSTARLAGNFATRSISPINGANNLVIEDGRKYKKGIIEEHLSQLTFTPNLSSKTKEIDQLLTQKLLSET